MMHPPQHKLARTYPLAILLLVLLTGCAHRLPSPPQDWSTHSVRVQNLSHWQITGKLGVRIPGDNGSANLRWQNQERQYTLDLSGPFGQGRLLIRGKPGRVTLQQPGEAPLMADSAEDLIYQTTGWTLPVMHLAYWVRGVPAPHHPVARLELDESGRLAELQQAGWHIQYQNYQTVPAGNSLLQLPGRVTAEYGDIRLTLIIRQWQLD